MSTLKYYPSIKNLIPLDSFPEIMGSLTEKLEDTLDKIYYKNLYANVDFTGASSAFQLDLIPYKELSFEIPGTKGMLFLINPGNNNEGSVIPIYLIL